MDTNSPLISETDDVAFDVKVYGITETGAAVEVTAPTTEAGSYYVEIVGLKGEDAGNYALGNGLTLRAEYTITKMVYEVADHIKFDNDEVTFDNDVHTLSVKLDDGYELPETVTVTYTTEFVAEEEDFTKDDYWITEVPSNGGRYAGVYTVTVTFTDSASGNYEPLDSMSATLTIKKAKFFDYYNKDGVDLLRDAGFTNNSYAYVVGTNYNPYIASGILTNSTNFDVTYEYYRVDETQRDRTMLAHGTHAELVAQGDLISLAGKYEIVAHIEYVSAIYRNNFEEIDENDSTITYVIRAVDVAKVEVVAWADGFDKVVKLGEAFDYSWIKQIDVTYAGDAGKLEVTREADIALAGIKFEQKNNVDQTTFWKVGAFNVIVSFYGTESAAYEFTVKETINSVQVQYSTDGGNNYHDVPEDGIEFVEGAHYQFIVLYTGTDSTGRTGVQMQSTAVAA
ncbi:MAG: hypothetical protein K2N50_04815, partial [Clostridia bacterium]|nr:hypothetical protein [Clostridia bacterium]